MNKSEGVFLQENHQYIYGRQELLTYANLLFYYVAIVEKESQLFYNIHYRCLKRINFSFKTPASPFSPT